MNHQARADRPLIETNEVFVTATVLLETEWVLRALRGLLGLPNLHADAPDRLDRTLKWYEDGTDLADAMHLAFSEDAEYFATFNEKLVRRAQQIENISVRVPTDKRRAADTAARRAGRRAPSAPA
jgi:hypothetical protein